MSLQIPSEASLWPNQVSGVGGCSCHSVRRESHQLWSDVITIPISQGDMEIYWASISARLASAPCRAAEPNRLPYAFILIAGPDTQWASCLSPGAPDPAKVAWHTVCVITFY